MKEERAKRWVESVQEEAKKEKEQKETTELPKELVSNRRCFTYSATCVMCGAD